MSLKKEEEEGRRQVVASGGEDGGRRSHLPVVESLAAGPPMTPPPADESAAHHLFLFFSFLFFFRFVQLRRSSPSRSAVAVLPCLPLSSTSHVLLPSRHPQPSPLSPSSLAPHLQPPSSSPPSPSPFSPSPSPPTAWPSILVVDLVVGGLDRVFPKPDLLYPSTSRRRCSSAAFHRPCLCLIVIGRLAAEDKNQGLCISFYFVVLSSFG
jgi:hypothetical protein